MATRFLDTDHIKVPLDTFTRVEQDIHSYFDTIIRISTIRRDELLRQLHHLKWEYLNKIELRKKQVRELEQMISQLDEMNIQQNMNLKLHEDHLNRTKEELRKAEQPTPVPVPGFIAKDLQSLLQRLERIGTFMEVSRLYSDKRKPVKSIGKYGNKSEELNCPLGIRLDDEEKIYVCDSLNSRIQVFSREGKFVTEFGKGHLSRPYDIELHDILAFVSDRALGVILKFQISDFEFERKSAMGVVNGPRGLTVYRNEVLVADRNNLDIRIAVLNLELEYLREFGRGIFRNPCDVKRNLNKIFVLDKNQPHNVNVLNESADLLFSMISMKDGTDNMFMCLDQFSNILISDSADKSIQIFTLEGQLMHSIQCEGYPRGVAVAVDNTTIVCAEFYSITLY